MPTPGKFFSYSCIRVNPLRLLVHDKLIMISKVLPDAPGKMPAVAQNASLRMSVPETIEIPITGMPLQFSEVPISSELAGPPVLNCRLPDVLVVPGMSTGTAMLPKFVMPKQLPKFRESPTPTLVSSLIGFNPPIE